MVRRILASAALAFTLVASVPAAAQNPALTPEHLAAAREVVVASGISSSFDSIYGEFRERMRLSVGVTRPELQKDMAEVLDQLRPIADQQRDQMIAISAEAFARLMTQPDLRDVAAFFNSPVGQRYNAFRAQAIDMIFTAVQPWSVQTSNLLFERFSAEMKKRGHAL